MSEILPFALSYSIGFLLIAVFDPLAFAVPRWAALLFRINLGSGVGIGFSAIVYLALLTIGFARPVAILSIEITCASILAALWTFRRRSRPGSPPSSTRSRPDSGSTGVSLIMTGVFVCGLLLVGYRLIQTSIANPAGEWDASAIWNLRAKFLADQQHWQFVASPLAGTRPEYPLLISSFIARGWKLRGAYVTIVPILLGLTFWAALHGLKRGPRSCTCGATCSSATAVRQVIARRSFRRRTFR